MRAFMGWFHRPYKNYKLLFVSIMPSPAHTNAIHHAARAELMCKGLAFVLQTMCVIRTYLIAFQICFPKGLY